MERTAEDDRTHLEDLKEKLGDLQRENQRLKVNANSDLHEKELINKELVQFKIKCDEFFEDRNILRSQLQLAENTIDTERALHEVNLMSLKDVHLKQINDLREINTLLEQDRNSLENKIREESAISKTFDDYKRRAQAALKQANTTSSLLTTEINELKKTLDISTEQMQLTLEANDALKAEQLLFIHKLETLTCVF